MKKYNIFSLFFLMLLSLLAGCSKEEKITFDSELPRFDLRPGYQLLEVIVPQGTLASDNLYIVGEFNGGVDVAVGDPRWQLEKASDTDVKWGIYLNPDDFVEGKTLADGYTFYSVEQGEERSLENTPVIHTEAPAVGARINVLLYRWAEYFNKPANPEEIVHDGYVIYVVDNSGYDELALYAWEADAPEPFGGWPGMTPTGKVEIDGVTYKYFDTKESNKGRTINLIFNNNDNGKQLADYPVTLDQDFYLEVTPDGVVEFDPSSVVTHDGYVVYVVDNSGYDELALYAWEADAPEPFGGWPGMTPTGEIKINGVNYKYFDTGDANKGRTINLIFNNNDNGKQLKDYTVTLEQDFYFELTASGATEIDPNTYVPGGAVEPEPEPEPEPTPGVEYKIYVVDNSGYDELALYAYEHDAPEPFGGWPGMTPAGEVEINGVNYKYFNVGAANAGRTINLIFNNNGNEKQLADYTVTLNQDFYLELTPEGVTELDPVMTREGYVIYVVDNSGYDELALYAYEHDAPEPFGGWPGMTPAGEVEINGVNYKYFDTEAANAGRTINLIFNNNGNEKQLADYPVTLNQDFYLELTPEGVVEYKP